MKILYKARGIFTLLFSFQAISMLTLPFLLDSKDIEFYAPQILLFCITLSNIIANSNNLLDDNKDGSLVQKLLLYDYMDIVIAKQSAIFLASSIITLIVSIMALFFYSLNLIEFLFFLSSTILILFVASALAFCSSVIKLYFDNNTEYLSMIMMPLLIPFFICSSLSITSCNYCYLLLMLGMNLILIPIISFMSGHLLRGVYSFS